MEAPFRVEVWLPIPSLRHVNSYIFTEGGEVCVVDPGMYSARSVHSLLRGLRTLGLDPRRISTIIATHFHVDHLTGAAIIKALTGSSVYLGRVELASVLSAGSPREYVEAALGLFSRHGMPPSEIDDIRRNHPALRVADAYKAIFDEGLEPVADGFINLCGQKLEVITLPGHTPGHIALVDPGRRYAITGDVVLMGITPHVILHNEDADPLGDYLESLRRLISYNIMLLLPGHRDVISDPAARIKDILKHHEERLTEMHSILAEKGPLTAYEVARKVRWRSRYATWSKYPPAERFFAMGETLAHLRRLEVEGRAERLERGGITLWRAL